MKLVKDTDHKLQLDYRIEGMQISCPDTTLHKLLEQQSLETPNGLAIQFDEEHLTYKELQQRINQTAQYLWSQGVRPNQVVAISLERTPALIISIFAVLQCGACYVPIDASYPDGRLELMITDSEASFFITSELRSGLTHNSSTLLFKNIADTFSEEPTTAVDVLVESSSRAYIIYTSGSTGKPKGVEVAHESLINLVYSMGKEPGMTAQDRILSVTSISFDIMVLELYFPLLHGACVVQVDENTRRDGHLLLQKAIKEDITIIWGTPTTWQILVDSGWEDKLPVKALIGGEQVPYALAQELLKRTNELWNIYGPTETTVCSLLTQIKKEDNPITIGKPVANTLIYLLDEHGNQVKEGEVGEIIIGGNGVSLGYLNRPELTNKSFVSDLFREEEGFKMYHSGDLGRLLPNGEVECLGRRDKQVKLRGHRIELGEIEAMIKGFAGVNSVVVDVQSHVLKAYVVVDDSIVDQQGAIKDWKEKIKRELPSYMVPQDFTFLDEIPVTTNGKLDKAFLANLNISKANQEVVNKANSETEKIVSKIWQKTLNLDEIDIQSNFFDLGGHSLVAAKVMTEIEKATEKRLPLAALFEHATVEKLAVLLELDEEQIDWGSLVPIKPEGSKLPVFLVHGAGLNVLNYKGLASFVNAEQPVYGLQAKGLSGNEELLETVEEIAAYYVSLVLETQPEGPYAIGGYSFGGVIAYEMAVQLIAKGKEISTLAIFDTYVYPNYGYKTKQGKKIGAFKFFVAQKIHTLKHIFGSLEGFKFRLNKYRNMLNNSKKRATVTNTNTFGYDEVVDVMEANSKAISNYHLKPAALKIDLFRAKEQPEYMHDYINLGWRPFALNGVEVYEVPGDHFSIFSSPNDETLAKVVQQVLDKSNA